MLLSFRATDEAQPGRHWRALFQRSWWAYRAWFLREGDARRPGYVRCRAMLRKHMPELIPIWERLVDLAGGGDIAARMLSLYSPTPYLTGCSQAVWSREPRLLARNYDYDPRLFEAQLVSSRWHSTRVLAMSECLWGVLDGVNEHGLCVSLAFGGRRDVGPGFGIPLILRYILEFCGDVPGAVAVLNRVPSHMSYNISLLDARGASATVHVAPDRPTAVLATAVATNHQGEVEWQRHAEASATLARAAILEQRLGDPTLTAEAFVQGFLWPPLYRTRWREAFGTLYTAVYDPARRSLDLVWPGHSWSHTIDHPTEGERLVLYTEPPPA